MTPSARKFLIVIGGATATGKTAASIQLAKEFDAEILSADSRQFYREMSIGTGKPSPEELAAVPHHFIDSLSIQDDYSVGDFEKQALATLDQLYQTHNVAILVGGSGLFLRAVCEGLDYFPDVPAEVRQEVEALYEKQGLEALQEELERVDPVYCEEVDLYNPHRLIRALSVCRSSGRPFSDFRNQEKEPRPFTSIYLLLQLQRQDLYDRIHRRVDGMVADGLVEEVRNLYPYRHLNALQTVGYQELFDHFDGKCSLEEAVDKIKQHSRNFAKRQGTWFRKRPHWNSFHPDDIPHMIQYVRQQMLI
jgi:tRNA dimethylallyltransferase